MFLLTLCICDRVVTNLLVLSAHGCIYSVKYRLANGHFLTYLPVNIQQIHCTYSTLRTQRQL